MSTELVIKMIAALRDTAAKTDEVIERQEVSIQDAMAWGGSSPRTHTVSAPRYEREWIAGRLLGMADMAEAMIGSGQNLADANPKDPLP